VPYFGLLIPADSFKSLKARWRHIDCFSDAF